MIDFDRLMSLLSGYIDEDLDRNICDEINELIEEDVCCRYMFNTLEKTIDLCHDIEMLDVPEEVHIELYRIIKIEISKKR
ncbi:MAG: hypothetical protein AUJ85_08480 [Elusimicrobia bacterium CG1_02_37_114]|nr:MAG: hypothetical protein AUJ85_08480 [Elusimicrobia bacterium CG1_02_37_114]PIV53968.1 MAG: hypothetical protein COS17_01045 [Elusimicrobia bacterium CG02_land_8_20_14_3_00_37_13]